MVKWFPHAALVFLAACTQPVRGSGDDDDDVGGDGDADADGDGDVDADGDGDVDADGDGDADADGERCNGEDDDGDGTIDLGPDGQPLTRTCETSCGAGDAICEDGEWICYAPPPRDESCNGADDDCDGEVDEVCECAVGQTRPCGPDPVGICRAGVQSCEQGAWGACSGAREPGVETCGNRLDDDCDGETDETCECTPGSTQLCGDSAGECRAGTQTCEADGGWGACVGGEGPGEEQCNGLDDDCDGRVDETWADDPFEDNDDCDALFRTQQVDQDAGPVVLDGLSLYPFGDEDWFTLDCTEALNVCVPGSDQCSFQLVAQITLDPALDPNDVEVCLVDGACNGSAFCATDDDWSARQSAYLLGLTWGGVCGFDDSRTIRAVVRRANEQACGGYTASFSFERVDVACL